jgi:hypothetical protein
MRIPVNPDKFGLHRSVVIEQLDSQVYALVVRRKTRIIMADGKKLLEKASKIKEVEPAVTVCVETSAPVCTKTRAFLAQHGIDLHPLDN